MCWGKGHQVVATLVTEGLEMKVILEDKREKRFLILIQPTVARELVTHVLRTGQIRYSVQVKSTYLLKTDNDTMVILTIYPLISVN